MENLKQRVLLFLNDTGLAKTQFAKSVGISRTGLYRWIHDDLELSESTQQRIDAYLESFNR